MTRLLACALVITSLAGCERLMHNMYEQPRYDPGDASPLFPDGKAARPPPANSVPMAGGEPAAATSGRRGGDEPRDAQAAYAAMSPPPTTRALLMRGQERYTIYCLPCHGPAGDGDGPVTRRGFPHPPTYHQPRLREAPDRHFFDVMTHGYGIMYSYADRVAPADRWAIVAYIRALQLSQHAPVASLPASLLDRLAAAPGAAASGSAGPQGARR
jgi:mono/diheme cytochrome c family protein